MSGQLTGKVALVTGASSGIGREAALLFAAEGAKVVVSARREAEGEATAAAIRAAGGTAFFQRADVANAADVKALVAATLETYGRLDVAFNNAGIEGKFGPVAEQSEAEIDQLIAINLKGALLSLQHEIPALLQTGGGSIIFNASIVGSVGFGGAVVYSATKGGVLALSRAAAIELAKTGIRVNSVSPGLTLTEMTERAFGGAEGASALAAQVNPQGRILQPIDIARAALYLASDHSALVTGQNLIVDGGYTAQ